MAVSKYAPIVQMIAPIALVGASSYWSYQKFEAYDKLFASVMQRNIELEDLIIRLYKDNKKTYRRLKKLEQILWTYGVVPPPEEDGGADTNAPTRNIVAPPVEVTETITVDPELVPDVKEDHEDEIGYDDSDDEADYDDISETHDDNDEEDEVSSHDTSSSSSHASDESDEESDEESEDEDNGSSSDDIMMDDMENVIHLSKDGEQIWDPEKKKWYKATGKIGKALASRGLKMKTQHEDDE